MSLVRWKTFFQIALLILPHCVVCSVQTCFNNFIHIFIPLCKTHLWFTWICCPDVFYFLYSLSDPCLITLPCNSIQLFYLYCTYLSYMHVPVLTAELQWHFATLCLGQCLSLHFKLHLNLYHFQKLYLFLYCICSGICICFGICICICICTVLGPVTDHQSGWGHTLVTLGNRWQTPNRPLSHPLFLFSNTLIFLIFSNFLLLTDLSPIRSLTSVF